MFLGMVLIVSCTMAVCGGQSGDRERVLIVCDERVQMETPAKYLGETGKLEVEIVDQESFPASISGFRAVIDFVHKPFTDRVEKALIDYCEAGGRLISLHHSISSSKRLNKHWLDFCGMTLPTGPRDQGGWFVVGNTTVELVNLRPDHYVTSHNVKYQTATEYGSPIPTMESSIAAAQGKRPALEFQRSEVFLGQQFAGKEPHEILFGLKCFDPTTSRTIMMDRGGWYQRKGKGWHFYFQVGHATGDFQNPAYRQVLLNAIRWRAAGREKGKEKKSEK